MTLPMDAQTLTNVGLLWCCRPSKVIERDVEPLVDLLVNDMILVADLLWRQALLPGFCFGGSAVLVCSAHVQCVVSTKTAEPSVDVRTEKGSGA